MHVVSRKQCLTCRNGERSQLQAKPREGEEGGGLGGKAGRGGREGSCAPKIWSKFRNCLKSGKRQPSGNLRGSRFRVLPGFRSLMQRSRKRVIHLIQPEIILVVTASSNFATSQARRNQAWTQEQQFCSCANMENPGSKCLMKLWRGEHRNKLCLSSAYLVNLYFYRQSFEEHLFLRGIPSPRDLGLLKLGFSHFSTYLETIYTYIVIIIGSHVKACQTTFSSQYF